jgi:hypothetical protein
VECGAIQWEGTPWLRRKFGEEEVRVAVTIRVDTD